MFELHVYKGERLRQVIQIERRMYSIGRSMTTDIVIPDQRVSRKHCTLYFSPDTNEFRINDLNSKLGTYVNGLKINTPHALQVGDAISFGSRSEFVLRFMRVSTDTGEGAVRDDAKHITSSINIRKVLDQSERSLIESGVLARRKDREGDKPDSSETDEVAAHFYDLSTRLALGAHHQQVYDILADHIFETTPADRVLVVRLKPSLPEGMNPETPLPAGHFVEFCEFSERASANAKSVATEFSRSMVRKASNEQKGLLFTPQQDHSESMLAIRAQSSICAPILGRVGALGCLYLDVLDSGRGGFTSVHLRQVGMYAYIFGLYLERQKALEEKRESERLATAGLAVFGAAHYLKNVLTGLQGGRQVIDLLLRNKQYDQLEQTWAVMTRSLDAIGSTIKKMLEFARSPQLHLGEADAVALAEGAAGHYRSLCADKGIALDVRTVGDPFTIRCDRGAIDDVLQNLIGNAIDALRYDQREHKVAPRITVRIQFRHIPRAVLFEVQDTGPGIPEEIQGRLFDLFFSTKGAGGSGLGLALCQKYVVAHNGTLSFTTSADGTTFRVTLPQIPGMPTGEAGAIDLH